MMRALSNMTISGPKQSIMPMEQQTVMPMRPGFGTAGRAIKVLANYFSLKKGPNYSGMAVHYDVHIVSKQDADKPRGPQERPMPGKLCKALIGQLARQEKWGLNYAFDGRKNIYSPGRFLPPNETRFEVVAEDEDSPAPAAPAAGGGRGGRGGGRGRGEGRDRTFVITIKEVSVVDMNEVFNYITAAQQHTGGAFRETPREALQVLDVLIRFIAASSPTAVAYGRSVFFNNPNTKIPLPGGTEAWNGFTQSFKACQNGLMLALDTATSAFLKAAPLPQVMMELLEVRVSFEQFVSRPLRPDMPRKLQKALYNIRVMMIDGRGRRRTIKGVTERGANQVTFYNDQEKRETTVADYFAKTGRPLRFPNLPCINVGPSSSKPVFIPPEMCATVPGQRRTKLTPMQTREIIKLAAQRPQDKVGYIRESAAELASHGRGMMETWGLQMDSNLTSVDARVLPQPVLAYGNPAAFDVGTKGAWNLQNVRFAEGRPLEAWAVCSLMEREEAEGENPLSDFLRALYKMCYDCGISLPTSAAAWPPIVYAQRDSSVESVMRRSVEAARQKYGPKPLQLILVLLPTKDTGPYKDVKHVSDTELGIPSQCFVAKPAGIGYGNYPRGLPQYCANVALKINAKLDGVNAKLLDNPSRPGSFVPVLNQYEHVMVLGADVTHPTGGGKSESGEKSIGAVVASRDRSMCRYASRMLVQDSGAEVIVDLQTVVKELLINYYRENNKAKPAALLFYRDGVSEGQFREVMDHEYAAIRKACASLDPSYKPAITFVVVQKRHNTRLLPTREGPNEKGNIMPGTVVDRMICNPFEFDFYLNSHAGIQGTNKAAHYHVLVDEMGFGADGLHLLTYWLTFTYARCTRSVSYVPPAYYAHLAAFRGRTLASTSDSSSDISGVSGAPQFATIHPALSNKMYYM